MNRTFLSAFFSWALFAIGFVSLPLGCKPSSDSGSDVYGSIDGAGCGVSNACVMPGTRDVTRWPFASCGPFNHPIGSEALYEPITPVLTDPDWDKFGNWTAPMNWSTFGCLQRNNNAIYVAGVPPTHQGVVRRQDNGTSFPFLLPDNIHNPPDIDSHLFVLDPAADLLVETWQSRIEGGNVVAPWVESGKLSDDGVLPPSSDPKERHRGTRAYGGSGIAGLIRPGELTSGIHHALAIKVPGDAMNRNGPDGSRCFTWPATACDACKDTCYTDRGNVYMGSLLAIPPKTSLDDITDPRVRAMARALMDYGAYVVDGNTNIDWNGFSGCVSYLTEWNEPESESLETNHEQLGRLTMKLRVVANNGPNRLGGGGVPRTCFAPPLQ